ncbi:hypothetical protein [Taibaiella helva]|uniref:hypothetical protein n=1 Tax=Taibaiella helva TaxID=2301235 RepID=UPI00130028A8|nr:hypothetical protein [Taibaiella helva]
MTKKDRKRIISSKLDRVSQSNDESEVSQLLGDVIVDIYSAEYPIKQLPFISNTVNTFIRDFVTDFGNRQTNSPTDSEYLAMSKAGLITLIDISLLPNE